MSTPDSWTIGTVAKLRIPGPSLLIVVEIGNYTKLLAKLTVVNQTELQAGKND